MTSAMSICPICNGLREIELICTNCGSSMMESGRLMDFYDDYSPYMEIDLMKLEDGYPDTNSGHKCPHLYQCPSCNKDEIVFIKE
jgi:transcription elongation factor Elf1